MKPTWRDRLENLGVVAALILLMLLAVGVVNCVVERLEG
jgi:hypothetical protein